MTVQEWQIRKSWRQFWKAYRNNTSKQKSDDVFILNNNQQKYFKKGSFESQVIDTVVGTVISMFRSPKKFLGRCVKLTLVLLCWVVDSLLINGRLKQ